MNKYGCVFILFFSLLFTVLLFLDENKIYSLFIERNHSIGKSKQPLASNLSNELRKPKYIWLMTDAWASFHTGDLASFSNYSAYYHIANKGYPQSAAIAATQFLSRPSRNYVGNFLNEETIFEQINNFQTDIIANEFPILGLTGSDRFDEVTVHRGRERHPLSRLDYYSVFPEPSTDSFPELKDMKQASQKISENSAEIAQDINSRSIKMLLDLITKFEEKSLCYYTTIMDSYNHNYGAFSFMAINGASLMLAEIKSIIMVIEDSEYWNEYILIVSSDHGGQLYLGEDEICNHGCQAGDGNEGFLFIYSYGTAHFEDWINNEDLAAILAGYITDANIPLHSTGWPRPIQNGGKYYIDEFIWKSYRQKEAQLLALLNITQASGIEDLSEFSVYLKKLQNTALQRNYMNWLLLLLIVAGSGLCYKLYQLIGYQSFGFLCEHLVIILFIQPLTRIEQLMFYPAIIVNFIMIIIELKNYQWSKLISNNITIKIVISKIEIFCKSHQRFVILLCNLVFLITKPSRIQASQIYTYYYIHFLIITALIYLYISFLPIVYRLITASFTLYLEFLMLYYEHITDYSMTDQTEDMIYIIRIFYFSLLGFLLLILLLPQRLKKRKLLGIPIVLLFFFIGSQDQRSFCVFYYLLSLYILAEAEEYNLILLLATSTYLHMHGTFGLDISLRAGNKSWGVNPDEFPIFTGFIFGVHKLSWYMIAGCAIMITKSFNRLIEPLVLRALTALVVFFYIFYFYPASSLSGFMWAMSQSLLLIISHSFGLFFTNHFNVRDQQVKITVEELPK